LRGQGFRPEEMSAASSSAICDTGVDTAFCRMSERLTLHFAVSRQTQSETHPHTTISASPTKDPARLG
jgi:hypothetical protein